MSKSKRYNWPDLLAEFEQSDLSQVAFCNEHDIDPKHFCLQRNKYLNKAKSHLCSLIETAKANGINPYEYLKQVFKEFPNAQSFEDIERLLPWNANLVWGVVRLALTYI